MTDNEGTIDAQTEPKLPMAIGRSLPRATPRQPLTLTGVLRAPALRSTLAVVGTAIILEILHGVVPRLSGSESRRQRAKSRPATSVTIVHVERWELKRDVGDV